MSDEFNPDDMAEMFVQEARENLQVTEEGLLDWGKEENDVEIVGTLFRQIHSIKGNCGFFGYADMEKLTHRWETVLQTAKNESWPIEKRPVDLFLKLTDVLSKCLDDIASGGTGVITDIESHIAELDVALNDGQAKDAAAEVEVIHQSEEDTDTVEDGRIGADTKDDAAPKTNTVAKTNKPEPKKTAVEATTNEDKLPKNEGPSPQTSGDIRVSLSKLDSLINLIGEMVIAQNMLVSENRDLITTGDGSLNKSAQQMMKITRELQELAVSVRMIPVSGVFKKMTRLAHDVSRKLKKKVDVVIEGSETEIDKTVIEMIADPMVHILRNAVDHGIETPEARKAAGKNETGRVRLAAMHEEGEVWIVIEDNGKGLDKEKILAKAIENGLIVGDGSDLSDSRIYSMIFQPGFSTAAEVTDVSGRGVGMDVVKRNLEKIQGRVEIQSFQGEGSKFTLRIPLTLAIIDGMLIRIGNTKCVIPLLGIKESFTPTNDMITETPDGFEVVKLRNEFHPILYLKSLVKDDAATDKVEDGVLVMLEHHENRFALLVDEILGQQQTVVKALPSYVGNLRGLSGCTILGDGSVCLILDIGGLDEMARTANVNSPKVLK